MSYLHNVSKYSYLPNLPIKKVYSVHDLETFMFH